MATSIRIHVGLQAYQIEPGHGHGAGALSALEARRLLGRVREGHERGALRTFVRSLCRSTLEWEDDEQALDDLIRSGRIRVRPVDAWAFKAFGDPVEAPAPEHEPVQNEIVETHTVEIELLDAEDNPVPGEPYRITLPDGTVKTGTLDDQGRARIVGIEQAGTCQVCFYQRDAAAWAPA